MSTKPIISYAQNREDIILAAILSDIAQGFYVDIGANDPEADSVTKFFYQRGWRGVNVEPIPKLYRKLSKARPADTNLNCGVSDKPGKLTFREFTDTHGHSTFSENSKKLDLGAAHKEYQVPVITLEQLFREHTLGAVHFLKIDVEGLEYEVIKGNDWSKYRPEVVCIESNHSHKDWKSIFSEHDYDLIVMDGLNEYYLAKESLERLKDFSERLVILGDNVLKKHQYVQWQDEVKRRKAFEKDNNALRREAELLRAKIERQSHSHNLLHRKKDN